MSGGDAAPLADQPTLDEVKAWLGVTNDGSDQAIAEALTAAVQWQRSHLVFPADHRGHYYPPELRQACLLRVRRLLARRDSPVGVVGFGDYGAVSVGRTDPDVDALESAWRDLGPW